LDFHKLNIAKSVQAHSKKIVSLKGTLNGLKLEGKDIKEAKKSLFKADI